MRKVKQFISFFLFAVIMFSFQSINAQTTAAVNGTVVDQNGSPLPGANIIAVHQPSGTQYGTTSRLDGKYNLVSLRVGGPYKVTVSFVGYAQQVEEGVNLALGQNLKLDFKLPEQAVQLTGVTITAEKGAVLSQARTGAAQNVSIKQIEEIPTLNRNFAAFAKLSPQFSGIGSLNAGGRQARFNNVQIDGTAYSDPFSLASTGGVPGGTANLNPISFDAIREFQIVLAPYDVKFSGFTGAGINAITRSGTNKFEGSAFFYGRHQGLVGLRNPNTGQDQGVSDNTNTQLGVRVGGPIIKDKLFFFVSGEITANNTPAPTVSLQNGFSGQSADSIQHLVNRFAADLRKKGLEPGSSADFTKKNPSSKFMIKFDYNLSENHQLTLRNNYVDGYQDNMAGRSASGMAFDSYNYRFNSTTNSTALLLNSHFGNNMSNELIAGYTTVREKRTDTGGLTPLVTVKEFNTTYTMIAGFDNFSGANALDQDIIEFTDNFSYYAGNHTITVGTHNEFYKIRNLFIRNILGNYTYNSLADFENGLPTAYTRTYARFGDQLSRPAAEFNVAQLGFYIQDEWTVLPQVKINFGLRVEIPSLPAGPAQNDSVSKYFPGIKTSDAPSGNILWSPRVGFNWDVSGDRTTQIRGGLGIFSGKIPYVWISNNYGNSGMLTQQIDLKTAKTALPFIADPNAQYTAGSSSLLGAPSVRSEIDVADPNLKMPQLLKFNVAADQELPFGFVGTAEFMYSKTINDMMYRKLNLNPIIGYVRLPNGDYEGTNKRPIYGGENLYNNNFTDVLQIYNTSEGYQYNLSFQVQRNVARGLSISAAYNYMQAQDRNSLTSDQAQSQMSFRAVAGDPNNPPVATSDWEVTHRAYLSAAFTWEFFKNAPTTISIFYNGQSGRKFSFVSQSGSITTGTSTSDLNGDNYPGNDLFYIPRNSREILIGSISSSGQFVPATAPNTTYADLDAFINNDDYLSTHRGQIAERNGATAPWRYYLDLHFSQDIPNLLNLGAFQLTVDIQNVLNLINPDWGKVQDVISGNDTWNIVNYRGRVSYNGFSNVPVYSFTKPTSGTAYTYSDLSSRWQMQFGIRYTF